MKRIIYHGSEKIIEKPLYGYGNIHNDYGLGFYCAFSKELGKEWAARKTGYGYINEYVIDDSNLKILDLTKPPYNDVLYWVSLLMNNRDISTVLKQNYSRELKYLLDKYLIDITKYDIIIGFRADDSYFRFPEAFVRSEITLETLNILFKEGNLGKQYVLISERAFNSLVFSSCLPVESGYKVKYFKRKSGADKTFAELLIQDRYSKGIRLRDLVLDYE